MASFVAALKITEFYTNRETGVITPMCRFRHPKAGETVVFPGKTPADIKHGEIIAVSIWKDGNSGKIAANYQGRSVAEPTWPAILGADPFQGESAQDPFGEEVAQESNF